MKNLKQVIGEKTMNERISLKKENEDWQITKKI